VPATGFYEWRVAGRRKESVQFSLADGTRKVTTACLVTTTPNELVRDSHDRMPVIVPPDSYRRWLDNAPAAS
jgi:putative SOS response-associated peptidase YedK